MMTVLPFLDVIEASFLPHRNNNCKSAFNTFYNNSVKICFSKKYIEFLEKSVSNIDMFQSLIKELYDSKRILIFNPAENNSIENEFAAISNQLKDSKLIPFIFFYNEDLTKLIPKLLIAEIANPVNIHWIKLELLTKNTCNVSYQNFKSDEEVLSFFTNIFSIPNYITKAYVYNRELNYSLLQAIKGKHIDYYTFIEHRINIAERKTLSKELKKQLGGKLKLFYTTNARKLHERKIVFEDYIVTIDNSHNNLTIAEPTWEIFITYDTEKAKEWKVKCDTFRLVE